MPSRPTKAAAAAATLLLTAASAPEHQGRARALLIGVQDYPALPSHLRLQAPAEDAARFRDSLVAAGVPAANIRVMTEREGARPTRAAVMAQLAALADEARAGDRVLIYFSGHGSQAPARRPTSEPDGLEEIYLAADASGWDGARGSVAGAIADFELEQAITRVRSRGAAVWFVGDACHAAGLLRGSSAGAKVKSVTAQDLGTPPARASSRAANPEPAALRATAGPGAFAGFYAAPPGGLAVERPLPAGSPNAQPASVFTYAVSRAFAQGRFRTLRDLALAVSSDSARLGAPPPVFEGALGQSVLGLEPRAREFSVSRVNGRLVVNAGASEGLEEGAIVTLLALPDRRAIGQATVETSGLLRAKLRSDAPRAQGPLAARLHRRAPSQEPSRGAALLHAAAALAQQGPIDAVRVEARLWRGGCRANPPARLGFPPAAKAIDLLTAPELKHCDVLYLRLANDGDAAVDLTPLYVDASGAITALTLTPADDVRIEPGQGKFSALRVLARDSSGRPAPVGDERLVLIAAAAGPEKLDLRSLASPGNLRAMIQGPAEQEGLGALVFTVRVSD